MSSLRISTSCFGCIASSSRPLLASSRPVVASVASNFSPTQTRGKKTKKPDQRVVVRLLQDITQYGRRDTIMRIERGRMRNFWYPNGMAEYMTSARIQELALPLDEAISHREPWFVAAKDGVEGEAPEAPIAAATPKRTVSIKTLTAARAAIHIETILPPTLVFYRKPISSETTAIFGSVSADDVANTVREVLQNSLDEEAALVHIEARDVRFILPEDGAQSSQDDNAPTVDRIKALGRWEVDIVARGAQGKNETASATRSDLAKNAVPVRKIVEVVAAEEGAEA